MKSSASSKDVVEPECLTAALEASSNSTPHSIWLGSASVQSSAQPAGLLAETHLIETESGTLAKAPLSMVSIPSQI